MNVKIRTRVRGRSCVDVRQVVMLAARRKPRFFSRKKLGDGSWLINRYFQQGNRGFLIPSDIEDATHCERSVYDTGGNLIGTSIAAMESRF